MRSEKEIRERYKQEVTVAHDWLDELSDQSKYVLNISTDVLKWVLEED